MGTNHELLGEFVTDLSVAGSFEARFSLFEKIVEGLNFEGLTYTFFPRMDLDSFVNKPPVVMQTDAVSSDFIDHYVNGGLSEFDFTVRNITAGNYAPMVWRENEQCNLVSVEEANVIETAREDYGISNALTIPTMPNATQALGIAGVSVFSSENDHQFALLKDNFDTLVICAQMFHLISYACSDLHTKYIWPLFQDITTKERTMLYSLMQGKPMKQIASDANIQPKSAYRVFDGMREKLGGITLAELIRVVSVANLPESE